MADFSVTPDLEWLGGTVGDIASAPQAFCFLSGAPVGGGACGYLGADPSRRFPHLSIAADVRLHNRRDLTRHLASNGDSPVSTDADLVLAAYDKWGVDCARFLLGEFSFAIRDDRKRELFCCRDQMGFRPFRYWNQGSKFVFASTSEAILRVQGVPRALNEPFFASMAVSGAHEDYYDDTFHAGIQSLPSGSSLTVSSAGIHFRKYWSPAIHSDLVPKEPKRAFEALRELLFEAVDCRISDGAPFAVELSGGLDSSGVAAIAAKLLEKKGQTLLAVAGVLPEESLRSHADERDFIDEFRSWPNIRIVYEPAVGRGPFDGIENPGDFAGSPIRSSFRYFQDALNEASIRNGARFQLRGILGELGPTCYADPYYAELAVNLRWPTLWRELRRLREVEGINPIRHLAGRMRALALPRGTFRNNGSLLLRPGFCADISKPRMRVFAWPNQQLQQLEGVRHFLTAHATWASRNLEEGIRFSSPWLDKRVIEFCLAAPPEMKIRNGYRRNLIREALDGLLPTRIQWRTSKTAFTPDYSLRYNSQLWKAKEFVQSIGDKDPVRQVIDVAKLGQLTREISNPVKIDPIARDVVPLNIYAICFLRQFSEFRP